MNSFVNVAILLAAAVTLSAAPAPPGNTSSKASPATPKPIQTSVTIPVVETLPKCQMLDRFVDGHSEDVNGQRAQVDGRVLGDPKNVYLTGNLVMTVVSCPVGTDRPSAPTTGVALKMRKQY
jgi:hypothetical protein